MSISEGGDSPFNAETAYAEMLEAGLCPWRIEVTETALTVQRLRPDGKSDGWRVEAAEGDALTPAFVAAFVARTVYRAEREARQ